MSLTKFPHPDELQSLIIRAGAEKLNSVLLDEKGQLKLLPAAEWDTFYKPAVRLWCHTNARYGLPTTELVGWLIGLIGKRSAIEIGSGAGDLAYHLGIRGTDNLMQMDPKFKIGGVSVRDAYLNMGQPVIKYPSWIEQLDAVEAVNKYKPEVVVASWVTQWIDPNLPPPPGGGNIHGVKEDRILNLVKTYVVIGNRKIHGSKKILERPHSEYPLPFIRSRASCPEDDVVYVWSR